jgi:hypothetical protein
MLLDPFSGQPNLAYILQVGPLKAGCLGCEIFHLVEQVLALHLSIHACWPWQHAAVHLQCFGVNQGVCKVWSYVVTVCLCAPRLRWTLHGACHTSRSAT